jgi:hypothetical protein
LKVTGKNRRPRIRIWDPDPCLNVTDPQHCLQGTNAKKTWFFVFCRQLRDNETVTVGEADVSLLVLALRDINGAEENPDLEFMEHDLRGYLKCLVQVLVKMLIR